MQKLIKCLPILVFIVVHFSCNNALETKADRIAQANTWYEQQSYYTQTKRDSVLKYAMLIDSISKDMPGEYKAMALLGKAHYNLRNKLALSTQLYQQVLELLVNSTADSLKGRAYNGLGICYIKKSDYSNALDNYFKALRLFEKSNHVEGTAGVLANIGEVYQLKNETALAKKYILQSMEVNKEQKNIVSYLDAAQTLANLYGMNNQFDSALAIDKMGVAIADSLGLNRNKSSFYNNMGNCYMYSNRPDSARYFFLECLRLDSTAGNLPFMVDNYLTLGQLSLQQNQMLQGEQYFKKAITLADSIQELNMKSTAWKGLSTLYRQQNNFAQAIIAKDSATAVKDRIINEKSVNRIAELQELYETEKKEQTILLQQTKLSKQRLLLIGSVLLFALLILLGWMLHRKDKLKKEKELQSHLMQQREKATLDILMAEEHERRRIAVELHDGVGQVMIAAWMNLQVVESQMGSMDPAQQQLISKVTSMVGEGCKEVREVSHAMMPNALLNKGLVGAIRDFTQQIDKAVISINLHTEGLDSPIDDMVETILYRVIQESINNTIKHANANQLDISIHNNETGISLLIEDNGKGFDVQKMRQNERENTGLGLQNIQSRIAFLQGTVEWDSSEGNGTVVTIFIPAK